MKRIKKYYGAVTKFPNKMKKKGIKQFTSYALDKFVKSDYLRNNTNILPLSGITMVIRSLFNFLIMSRLHTGIKYIDFPLSVCITIILSLTTPLYYDVISYIWESDILKFTNIVVDNLWHKDGWTFFELWKGRILGFIGMTCIIALFFVEVTSSMIQEFILHMMICGAITEKMNLHILDLIEKKPKPINVELKDMRTSPLQAKIVDLPENLDIMQSYYQVRTELTEMDPYVIIPDYLSLEDGKVISNSFEESGSSEL